MFIKRTSIKKRSRHSSCQFIKKLFYTLHQFGCRGQESLLSLQIAAVLCVLLCSTVCSSLQYGVFFSAVLCVLRCSTVCSSLQYCVFFSAVLCVLHCSSVCSSLWIWIENVHSSYTIMCLCVFAGEIHSRCLQTWPPGKWPRSPSAKQPAPTTMD